METIAASVLLAAAGCSFVYLMPGGGAFGDENLGKIEELVMDPSSGQIRYAVLSMGGFLGMGESLFAVPWSELKLASKGTTSAGTIKEDHYVLDVTKEGLQNAPGFDKNNWPDFANREWTSKIDQFYMGRRPAAGTQTR